MVGNWREIVTGWAPHVIVLTGVVSFVLTVLSMHATKFATPLTVSVMGALKQARGRRSLLLLLSLSLVPVLVLVQMNKIATLEHFSAA